MAMINNTNIKSINKLNSPNHLINKLNNKINLSKDDIFYINNLIYQSRENIKKIINSESHLKTQFLLIIGPCSIHDPIATLDYAKKLKTLSNKVSDKILIVMRTYFEKPRTNIGWKGLINDPHLDNSYKINEGLEIARELLIKINLLGIPTATEFLDTISPQYLSDLISWGSIGARTVESQLHRQLASGLSCPIGFKNNTNGDIQTAIDAIIAAKSEHIFLGIDSIGTTNIIHTKGNDNCHIILRGSKDNPNYYINILEYAYIIDKNKVMIDCSHGNSQKKHKNQLDIINYYIDSNINLYRNKLIGFMIESNLEEGKQDIMNNTKDTLKYGQSITDSCIGWEDTENIIMELYNALD